VLRALRPGGVAWLTSVAILAPLLAGASAPAPAAAEPASSAEDADADLNRLVAILDYLAADYPGAVAGGTVRSASEYAEQVELASKLRPLLDAAAARRPAGAPPLGTLPADVDAVGGLVAAKVDPPVLQARVGALRKAIVEAFGVILSPSSPPSRENGAALFERACAPCHGVDGHPPADKLATLKPPPRALRDREVVDGLSPYRVFNTVTFGVDGTAMASFGALAARDRWDLAFWVLALAHGAGDHAAAAKTGTPAEVPERVPHSLAALAASTDAELRAALLAAGEADPEPALHALRTDLPFRADAGQAPIAVTRRLLDEALARAAAGDRAAAADLLVDAYLTGFERAEPLLRPGHGALVGDVETGFLALRKAVGDGEPEAALRERARGLQADLARAEVILAGGATRGPTFDFLAGAFIMVREGIEAALLVATLLALVGGIGRAPARAPGAGPGATIGSEPAARSGAVTGAAPGTRPGAATDGAPAATKAAAAAGAEAHAAGAAADAAVPAEVLGRARRAVHVGWTAALGAGVVTWIAVRLVVGRSGASPELVEGLVSLLAAAVLFYVSYWLLAKVESERWLSFLRRRILGSVSAGRLVALTGIAFLAVYREAFETILFYEALLQDRGGALPVAAGAGAGALVLGALIAAFLRLGRRLPLRPFFAVSGALLYALCVVLAGHGLQALRAAGVLSSMPLHFPRIEWLGVYPDVVGVAVQGTLLLAVLVAIILARARARARTRLPVAAVALLAGALALLAPRTGAAAAPATAAPAPAAPVAPPTAATVAPGAATSLRTVLPDSEIAALLADRAFLADVIALFDAADPDGRLDAAARLSAGRDPRAAAPLLAVLDNAAEPAALRIAVAAALGRFPTDTTRAALAAAARDTHAPDGVRTAAIDALGTQADAASGDTLRALRDDTALERKLRNHAGEVLTDAYPDIAASAPAGRVHDRRGLGLLIPVSGALGSYALATVGVLGASPAGIVAGALGGALVGAGTAWLITRGREVTPIDAFWFVHGGWLGIYAGVFGAALALPSTIDADTGLKIIMSFGLLGEAIGLGATFLTRRLHHYSPADVALMNLGVLAGGLAGAGTVLLALDTDGPNEPYLAAALGGSALLYVAAAALTRDLHLSLGDVALVGFSTIEAGWLGAWLPVAVAGGDATGGRVGGGLMLGAGLGFIAAVAAAQAVEASPATVRSSFLLAVYGSFLGAGVPLLFQGSTIDQVSISMLVGGVVGAGLGLLGGEDIRFRGQHASFLGLGTAWGLWQGLGWASWAAARGTVDGGQVAGGAFVGLAGGAMLGLAFSHLVPLSPWDAVALGAGGGWGAWIGAWGGAYLVSAPGSTTDPANTLLYALVLSDIGLAAVGVLLTPALGINPVAIGLTSLGGLAGAALGSLAVALVAQEARPIILGNLIGTGAGLLGGAILAAVLKLPAPPRREPRPKPKSGDGSKDEHAADTGWSFPVPVFSIAPSPFERTARGGRATLLTATIVY